MTDISQDILNNILHAQIKALDMVVKNTPLNECLDNICLMLESCAPNSMFYVGISLLKNEQLLCMAAPSLPDACLKTIQQSQSDKLNPTTQSLLKSHTVISLNTKEKEHWPNTHAVLKKFQLKVCGSWPIICQDQQVLGSLDIYLNKTNQAPDPFEISLFQHFAQFAAMTIEQCRTNKKRHNLIQSIDDSNQRMSALSQLIPDLMFVISRDGIIEDLFGGNHSLLDLAVPEFLGKNLKVVLPPDVSAKVQAGIERALMQNKIQIIHYSLNLPIGKTDFEGRIIPAEKNRETLEHRILYMARDMTQQNKDKTQIEQLAYYDSLTHLANRRLLLSRLEEKISTVSAHQLFGALVFIDLDDFKKINDSLGHSIGDEFLIMTGIRLKQSMPESCTLARIGGDEFVVLLNELSIDRKEIQDHVTFLTNKVISQIKKPFCYNQVEYHIGCSVGICVFDGSQNTTADHILQQADLCMYQAKKNGGQQLVVYDEKLPDTTAQRFKTESDIQQGIKMNCFHAYFQPQFDKKGQIISAESLLRWQIDGKEHLTPSAFIPVAENSSMINQLQLIVLEQSCQLIQQVDKLLGHQNFTLSINISANQFRFNLDQMLLETIEMYHLKPNRFKLEVTESVLLERSQLVTNQFNALQNLGFQFSIDDFGMGYSSLAYLHDLPIKELKIDKTFINQQNPKQLAIVKAITIMAFELDLDVIIEGVETEQQHQLFKDLNYTATQGFLFSKPLPFNDFLDLMSQQKSHC